MNEDFEQISLKPGFMKHNGGLLFKTISEKEYVFKTTIKENHLNAAGITHGGFIAAVVDAGAGTAAHRSAGQNPCVTISLELKFISAVQLDQEIIGTTKIQSAVPKDASQMYSQNITNILLEIIKDGDINIDMENPIISNIIITKDGDIVNSRIQQLIEGNKQ